MCLRYAKDGEVDQATAAPLFMCCMKYLRANIEFFIGVTMRNEGHDCSEMLKLIRTNRYKKAEGGTEISRDPNFRKTEEAKCN